MLDDSERTVNDRIARQVRTLRAGLGVSLEGLAAKSGVSRSMISLIERGKTSPTAVVLEKLAHSLDVALARLFDDAMAPADPISRSAGRVRWRDPQSGYIRTNLSPANHPSPLQLVQVELPPRACVAYETGARDTIVHQQIWVQDGVIEVTVGRATHQLSTNDCLAMQLDVPTAFHNPGRKTARYLVAIAHGLPAPRK